MHSQIGINHTSQQSESLTMADGWMQNDDMFLYRVEADSIGRSPLINILTTFIHFRFPPFYWQRTLELLEYSQIVSKQFLLTICGFCRDSHIAKKKHSTAMAQALFPERHCLQFPFRKIAPLEQRLEQCVEQDKNRGN